MYRVIKMSEKYYAVELLTSGRDFEDEFEEMQDFIDQGQECIITDDYEQYDAELVTREFL